MGQDQSEGLYKERPLEAKGFKPAQKRKIANQIEDHSNILKFLFLTYSPSSPSLEYEGMEIEIGDESFEIANGDDDYKKSLGIKGQFFKALTPKDSITPLIGIGGSLNLGSKIEDKDAGDYSTEEIGSFAFHGLFAGNIITGEEVNLIPYVGVGFGNMRYKGEFDSRDLYAIRLKGTSKSKIGFSHELGINFKAGRFLFGLSHQVINGKAGYDSRESGGLATNVKRESELKLKSTLLNIGLSF